MKSIYKFASKLFFTGTIAFIFSSVFSSQAGFADQSSNHVAAPQGTGGMNTVAGLGIGALPSIEGNFEKKTVNPDKSTTLEILNDKKVRTIKRTFNSMGQLSEEWTFDPSAGNRILRYKIVHYQNVEMLDERITFWDYDEKGGCVKNSRIYDSKQHLTGSYFEGVGPNGIKFKEEWFDAEGRMTGRKALDPNTGALQPDTASKSLEGKRELSRPSDETGKKSKEGKPGVTSPPVFQKTERRTAQTDGSLVFEIFDPKGRRTEKHLMDIKGHLVERWVFEPNAKSQITSYENYEYRTEKLQRYRIAEWHYQTNGEKVKTNRIFNGEGKQTGGFVEYENAQGKKSQEDWYDSKEKLVTRKIWDPETGAIKVHMRVTYLVGGLQRRTFLDSKDLKISENIYTSEGKPVGWGGAILGGASLQPTDRFNDLKNRDIAMNRPRAES